MSMCCQVTALEKTAITIVIAYYTVISNYNLTIVIAYYTVICNYNPLMPMAMMSR